MIERWSRREKEKSDIDIVVFDPRTRATLRGESAATASNTNHARRKTSNKKSYNDVKFYKARVDTGPCLRYNRLFADML